MMKAFPAKPLALVLGLLAAGLAAAGDSGISMREDANGSVELSNLPSGDGYQTIAAPDPAAVPAPPPPAAPSYLQTGAAAAAASAAAAPSATTEAASDGQTASEASADSAAAAADIKPREALRAARDLAWQNRMAQLRAAMAAQMAAQGGSGK